MPIWGWFFIAAIVVVAVAGLIVATSAGRRKRTDRLKEQFGPEYERTVASRERTCRARTQERQARHSSTDTGCAKGLCGPLARGADRVRRQSRERGGRRGPARDRGHARTRLPDRRLRSAGSRHLRRSPDGC